MGLYKLINGTHNEHGVNHDEGAIIESERDLCKAFKNKFDYYRGEDPEKLSAEPTEAPEAPEGTREANEPVAEDPVGGDDEIDNPEDTPFSIKRVGRRYIVVDSATGEPLHEGDFNKEGARDYLRGLTEG